MTRVYASLHNNSLKVNFQAIEVLTRYPVSIGRRFDVNNVVKCIHDSLLLFVAHDAVVTAAIFAPFPNVIMENPSVPSSLSSQQPSSASAGMATASSSHKKPPSLSAESTKRFEVLVAADWQGGVKFYINR